MTVSEGAQILADIIDQRGILEMYGALGFPLHPMHGLIHDFWEKEQYRKLRGESYWEIVGVQRTPEAR